METAEIELSQLQEDYAQLAARYDKLYALVDNATAIYERVASLKRYFDQEPPDFAVTFNERGKITRTERYAPYYVNWSIGRLADFSVRCLADIAAIKGKP